MSYTAKEKAAYLSVVAGTAIAIVLAGISYNSVANEVLTLNIDGSTYHAIKTPSSPHQMVQLDGYHFKLISKEDGFGCEGLTIQVIKPLGQSEEFKTCGAQGVNDPDRTYLIRYEKDSFGYAYNQIEGEGYFVVKVSHQALSNKEIDIQLDASESQYADVPIPRLNAPLEILQVQSYGESAVPPAKVYALEIDNKIFTILYQVTDTRADIRSIKTNYALKSLFLTLERNDAKSGTIEIVLPKELIDVKDDNMFKVLVDGIEVQYVEEQRSRYDITLSVPLQERTTTIEIVGERIFTVLTEQTLHMLEVLDSKLLIVFEEGIQNCCHSLDISPDGSMLAYSTSTRDNKTQESTSKLWLYDIRSNSTTQLFVSQSVSIQDINFSPYGNELMFLTSECNGTCILSLPDQKLSTISIEGVENADWMPDGSLVVLRHDEAEYRISLYDRNGNEKLIYIQEPYAILFSLKASPDGRYVAFTVDKPISVLEIYVLEIESGQARKVVGNEFRPLKARWSSDDRYLIYVQNLLPRPPDHNFQKSNPLSLINIVNVSNNQTNTIIRSPIAMAVYDLVISPDGQKIIYALDGLSSFPYVPPTQQPGIYVAESSHVIPEFPINLMAVTAIGLMGVLIAIRLKGKGSVD